MPKIYSLLRQITDNIFLSYVLGSGSLPELLQLYIPVRTLMLCEIGKKFYYIVLLQEVYVDT